MSSDDEKFGKETEDDDIGYSLESPLCSPLPENRQTCPSCNNRLKQPMVLNCLHVFCMDCLEKQIEDKTEDGSSCYSLECEKCKQETAIPPNGVSDLTPDYVLADLIELSDMEDMQAICTSCKAKEKAVARCQDCANYLGPNCVTAHQFMRCFEKHKVILLKDMKNGDPSNVHRPVSCNEHPSENLKNYCKTCNVLICSECMLTSHKPPQHVPEKVQDLESSEREFLNNMISESKSKITACEEAASHLMTALTELQNQRDNAKDLINETFQSYKALLEKRKDELLTELDILKNEKELALMDMCHNMERSVERLEDGVAFSEHILVNGSALHLLLMKKVISRHMLSLISTTPLQGTNVCIEFQTDNQKFEKALWDKFGHFKKEEPEIKPERPLSSLHSSFENEGFNHLQSGLISPDTTIMPQAHHDYIGMTPISRALVSGMADMHLDGLSSMSNNTMPGVMRSKSTIEHRSVSRNSHSPAMSDSGISMEAGSTGSSSSVPLVNIAALAKLGAVSYNAQGIGGGAFADLLTSASDNSHVTFNRQIVSGMNMSNMSGMPPVTSRGPTPISEIGMSIQGNRPQTPSLETLAGLLNQNQPPGMSGDGGSMTNIGTFNMLQTGVGSVSQNPVASRSMSWSPWESSGSGHNTPNPGSITPTFTPNNLTDFAGLSDSTSSMNTVGSNQSGVGGPPVRRASKMSAMQIRCKFGQLGPGKGQFNSPHGFCLGAEEDIIVADTNNHRIQVFEKTGEFKYQFGIPGREEGQLWYPRKVAIFRGSMKFIVCDRGNERSRMQIFTKNGHFVKKIAIRYIDIVAGLAITSQGHIVAVDSVSPTVFVINENGELIKWFDCSDYMREPSDIAISGKEYFVCDFKGHCVVVFNEEGHFQRRIGCENITNYPNGIDISDAGDVLVGDSHGNRFHVAVFQRDGSLIGEFECPYVKVSRCCGLKITAEGYVVTLAKNNHHVLVLNTLYIS
ncbi:B-box type zinc finger protein ncl-1-like isoform X2 [Dreissena polymorpha]|uniref:B-box type zinc finger protein ncl-1-like isoform X2 n=1 Tax=Dreissena polymorpha TaxID=45954 RepID=UPI0022651243|nr:B-box type zinc finger protein ncl-1-like isoform X2 [Dreissena polymorpha]